MTATHNRDAWRTARIDRQAARPDDCTAAAFPYLVTIDQLVTETSNFWQAHGDLNPVDPAKIMTEVFRLPSSCFAEEDGSLVKSGRMLQ